MDSYESLYGQRCRSHSGRFEVGEAKLIECENNQREFENGAKPSTILRRC